MTEQTSTMVVDTQESTYAQLRPVPLPAVRLADTFWEPRRRVNHETTLPSQHRLLEDTGRMDNFRRASKRKDVPFQGVFFNDSDVYKWLEAAAWALATTADTDLSAMVASAVDEIAAAQDTNGYLDTYFMFERAAERWTNFNLHEMYCAGHLFQAAVAHYRATGQTTLLDVAARFADHICDTFGASEQGKLPGVDGHPEVEMGLVELYRATGERRYLEQAAYFVDARGHGMAGKPSNWHWDSVYFQDHKPLREMERMYGHAVRAVYLNAGAADVYAEAGDPALLHALERMWHTMTTRQMYISGGLGSRYDGESFGKDYELPNDRAYTETCAAIGSVMWSWRMLAVNGEARYADLIETTMYNAVLPGLSLDGHTYFYQNPLADDGTHRREPWFHVACCPPNLARFLANLPSYFYSVSDETIWVHLYAEGTAEIDLPDGQHVTLTQHTRYPWDGDVAIDVAGSGTYSLRLRIPAWCETGASLKVNDEEALSALMPGSYVELNREWADGDRVQLHLPMAVRQVKSHPDVLENVGRVALMRGPLLYCVEQVDHPGLDVRDLTLPSNATFDATFEPDVVGGVVVLRGQANVRPSAHAWDDALYRSANAPESAAVGTTPLTAIPYYAWANRAPGPMLVWLKKDDV